MSLIVCSTASPSEADGIFLIIKGATTKELEFCLTTMSGAPPVEITSLRVATWYGGGARQISGVDTLWLILPADGRNSIPITSCIHYGSTPPGFGSMTAHPLVPNRYSVGVGLKDGGSRRAYFTLQPDGNIHPEKQQ